MPRLDRQGIIITIVIVLIALIVGVVNSTVNAQTYNPTYTNGYVVIDGKMHTYHTYEYKYGNVSVPLYNNHSIYGGYQQTSKEWDYGWFTFSVGSAVALVCGVCWAACYYANPPLITDKDGGQWGNALAIATYCGCGIVAVSIPLICVGDKKNKALRKGE